MWQGKRRKFCGWNLKIRAFTLLECLVALLAISGSVLVISGLTRLLQANFELSRQDQTQDWVIFCQQMRFELAGTRLDKVEDGDLYVTGQKALRFGLVSQDFRKTDARGRGYQPMLYGVKKVVMQENDGLVAISVDFQKGGERTFYYQFSKVAGNQVAAGGK